MEQKTNEIAEQIKEWGYAVIDFEFVEAEDLDFYLSSTERRSQAQ